jgi:lipoate-protein ligase A
LGYPRMWRWLDLDAIDPIETQTIYDAVATARGRNIVGDTLIFCYPRSPLVSLGYHQQIEKELDIEFCRDNAIPFVRRILGGGAVYLDHGQLFYQLIIGPENPVLPGNVAEAFRFFLQAPIWAYHSLGIDAEYRPVNDIQVHGRKISGNGAATTAEGVFVLTGNIMLSFDYENMVRVLKVPSEKFRDKTYKTLKEYLSTASRELGREVTSDEAKKALKSAFEKLLGEQLRAGTLVPEERKLMSELRVRYLSQDWLYMPESRHPGITGRTLKISEGVSIIENVHKAPGGLIRTTVKVEGERIADVLISGDFSLFPREKTAIIEQALVGSALDKKDMLRRIIDVYSEHSLESPGITPEDFALALLPDETRSPE